MYLTSPLLTAAGFPHAFFTREGGVSEGPYASLNFSTALGDAPHNVAENLRRAAQVLGVHPSKVYFLDQIHGALVHEIDDRAEHDAVLATSGDALISKSAGLALGVRTADCVPILLACPDSGWAAAAHAGWRGAVAGIAESTVLALRSRGASGSLLAAIGPHISVAAFEVSEEVAREIQGAARNAMVLDRAQGVRPHADLRKLVRAQLHAAGVERIDDVEGCTASDSRLFFSYRRDGKVGGRHLSAIVPRLPASSLPGPWLCDS